MIAGIAAVVSISAAVLVGITHGDDETPQTASPSTATVPVAATPEPQPAVAAPAPLPIEQPATMGHVKIGSTPVADLDVDDQLLGTTPFSGELPLGRHTVRLSADGYEDWVGQFAWTVEHAKWFKKQGAWGKKPEVGALVFYDWSGSDDIDRIDHVGVVTKVAGGRIHICHVSSARSVEVIRRAKERGVRVTAEATPHHLALTDEAVEGFDANTKMNPPLRAESDRRALIEGLADGTLDAVATDHAPHAPLEKLLEFDRAPFGIIGLETSLALSVTGLRAAGLSLASIVERMTIAPARILGLEVGTLRPGAAADVVVFDPDATWTLTPLKRSEANQPTV